MKNIRGIINIVTIVAKYGAIATVVFKTIEFLRDELEKLNETPTNNV